MKRYLYTCKSCGCEREVVSVERVLCLVCGGLMQRRWVVHNTFHPSKGR